MLVIGGGINGVGIARDAAGCGLSVRLVEKGDLAAATSSASSKLIHGGLRYLEHGAFRLVREALAEREVLLASAPHIIHPLPFVRPTLKACGPGHCSGSASSSIPIWAVAAPCSAPRPWPCVRVPMAGLCKRISPRVLSTRIARWTMPGWSSSMRATPQRTERRFRPVEMRSARRNGLTGAFSPRRRVCDGSRGAHSRKCGGAVGLRSPAPRGPDRTQSRSSADQREPYRGSPPLQRRAGVHSAEPSRIGSAPDTLIRAGQRWSR
jgi:hypothetical protein